MTRLRSMMETLGTRFLVNISDLREFDARLARRLILAPLDYLPVFEAVVKEVGGGRFRGMVPMRRLRMRRAALGALPLLALALCGPSLVIP